MQAPAIDEWRAPPPHPGEMLLEELLEPQGVTQVEAAHALKISTTRLNELIRGKRGVSADTAWRAVGHGAGGLDGSPEQMGSVARPQGAHKPRALQ
jgi:addiction module HigA family antidote